MHILVQSDRQFPKSNTENDPAIVLIPDSWNDYRYTTTYDLWFLPAKASPVKIGGMKIGCADLPISTRPLSPGNGIILDSTYFSVGQNTSYYEALRDLGEDTAREILLRLRDMTIDDIAFSVSKNYDVTDTSILRSVSRRTIRGQFRRILEGGAVLTPFNFTFTPSSDGNRSALTFKVTPDSSPPSNIHVIIGRNGSGKTTTLNDMCRAITSDAKDLGWPLSDGRHKPGTITSSDGVDGESIFSNLILVSFSAFDPFEYATQDAFSIDSPDIIDYRRIGLYDSASGTIRSGTELDDQFAESISAIGSAGRKEDWLNAINILESDPNFQRYNFSIIFNESAFFSEGDSDRSADARRHFSPLSSGHKIVLLTLTRLVELTAEKSLVLIDEPESHLHPPLLSAFIRSLSRLLTRKNGVAVMATHSPVVLQEVPHDCVWKLSRSGSVQSAERPGQETFGESIGSLTHDVFGLEASQSGFHKEIHEAVGQFDTYEQVLQHFEYKVGSEGKALIRVLLAMKSRGDN